MIQSNSFNKIKCLKILLGMKDLLLQSLCANVLLMQALGGFPIEIKTEIRYHIIFCYRNFTR